MSEPLDPSRAPGRLRAAVARAGRPAKVGVAGLAVLAVGAAAWGATQGASAAEYSTVDVSRRTVVGGLELTGTVTASGRSDLSFATSGTVARVAVAVGDTVEQGDVVARLDRTALKRAVTRAKAELDEARATLADDLEAQATGAESSSSDRTGADVPTTAVASSSGATSSAAGSVVTAALTTTTGTGAASTVSTVGTWAAATSKAVTEAIATVRAAQETVLSAQTAASTALTKAGESLALQQQLCADDVAGAACAEALAAVQADQQSVATAQQQLQEAVTALSDALDAAAKAVDEAASATPSQQPTVQPTVQPTAQPSAGSPSAPDASKPSSPQKSGAPTTRPPGDAQPTTGSSGSPTAPGGRSGSGTGSGGAGAGAQVTAATIAADQAAVDRARADLLEARSALSDATLRSPVSGTVAALDLAVGQEASAADVAVVVVGDGVTAVDADVAVDQVSSVSVGQEVEVVLAGRTEPVAGSVASVAATPTSGSSTYPVRVLVDGTAQEGTAGSVALGSTARLTVVTETADDVLSLPLSALTATDTGAGVVRVLDGGVVSARRVTLGTVGGSWVAVTDGLDEGESVVLAELGEAPTDAAGEVIERRGGPSGGFPGGAPGGGGPGGQRSGRGPGGSGGGR